MDTQGQGLGNEQRAHDRTPTRGENACEKLYKLHEPPHIIHQLESKKSDFMIDVILNPVTGTQTLSTKGLLDSGCTSSAIN